MVLDMHIIASITLRIKTESWDDLMIPVILILGRPTVNFCTGTLKACQPYKRGCFHHTELTQHPPNWGMREPEFPMATHISFCSSSKLKFPCTYRLPTPWNVDRVIHLRSKRIKGESRRGASAGVRSLRTPTVGKYEMGIICTRELCWTTVLWCRSWWFRGPRICRSTKLK